jgi:hypothetical protein
MGNRHTTVVAPKNDANGVVGIEQVQELEHGRMGILQDDDEEEYGVYDRNDQQHYITNSNGTQRRPMRPEEVDVYEMQAYRLRMEELREWDPMNFYLHHW